MSAATEPDAGLIEATVGSVAGRQVADVLVEADLDRRSAMQHHSARGPQGQVLWEQRDAVKAVAAHHGLTNLRVFGSVARGEDRSDSDVVLLVDLPEGMGLFSFGRAASELEDLLGIPVDLVPARSLKSRARPEIEAQAVPL